MTIKFKATKPSRGQSMWYMDLGNGTWVSYGWSYSANGSSFCTNRSTCCHVYAHADIMNAEGRRERRDEIFYEIVRPRPLTLADARRNVKNALARAKAAAVQYATAQLP